MTEPLLQLEQRQRRLGRLAGLVLLRRISTFERLRFVFHRQNAVADGNAVHGQSHDRASAFAGDDFEVIGFTPDHDADGNKAVIGVRRTALRRSGYGPCKLTPEWVGDW